MIAIGGEVLKNVHRAAVVAHDRNQIDRRHLRADEFLGRLKCAQLIGGTHGGHIEVERKQPAIFVAFVVRWFRARSACAQALVDLDSSSSRLSTEPAVWQFQRGPGARRNVIVCGDVVFGDREVLRSEAANRIALLVFDDDRFDHKLHLDRKSVVVLPIGERFWPICCAVDETAKSKREAARRVYALLEPHSHGGLQTAHRVDRLRQAKLRAFKRGNPAAENGMVHQVCCINASVKIKVLAGAKRALHRAVKTELTRSGDGVSACRSPSAGSRCREGCGV